MKRRGHSIIRCIILLFAYRSWQKLRETSVVIVDIRTSTLSNVNQRPYQLCHLAPRQTFLIVMLVFLCLVLGFKFGSLLLDGSVPFILFLSAADLSHRKPAITETSYDNCHVSGLHKRDTLYFIADYKVVHQNQRAVIQSAFLIRCMRFHTCSSSWILFSADTNLGAILLLQPSVLFVTLNVELTHLNNMK